MSDMAKTKAAGRDGVGFTLRFSADELKEVDGLVAELQGASTMEGETVTRSSALRHAVLAFIRGRSRGRVRKA